MVGGSARQELSVGRGPWWEIRLTAVSTAGSKAHGVSFKEAGVSRGKVGVRKRLLLLERPQRKQGYPGQVVVCCDITEFINRLSRFLESMATVGVG